MKRFAFLFFVACSSSSSPNVPDASDAAAIDDVAVEAAQDVAPDVDLVVVRHGKNLKGHTLAAAFTVIGKSYLGKAFRNTIKAIEARNNGTTPAS